MKSAHAVSSGGLSHAVHGLLRSAVPWLRHAGGVDVVDRAEQVAQLKGALGQRLADLRKAARLTQHDLARVTFLDRTYVSHAERGLHVPQRSFWVKADAHLAAEGALYRAYDELVSAQLAIKQAALDALRARHLQPGNVVVHHAEVLRSELIGIFGPLASGLPESSEPGIDLPLTAAHTVQVMEAFTGHDLINRRQVLQQFSILSGTALLRPVQQWIGLLPAAPHAVSTDPDQLDELDHAVRLFRRWDASGIGGLKRKAVIGQLRAVTELVRETSSEPVRLRLFHVMAELAQLAGWMSYDQGFAGLAQRYYLLALHACREAGAPGLAAKVLGDMMQLSTSLGHYSDSLNLAKAGMYALPRHGGEPVRVELLGLEARAYAQLDTSEHTSAVRSIESCLSAWHSRTDEPLPDWLHYLAQSEVDCLAANTYTQLALSVQDEPHWRRYAAQAEQHTLSALRTRNSQYERSRIVDELRLARVRLAQREPVEATTVATRALMMADHIKSSIVHDWLIRFQGELTSRYADVSQANEFTASLRGHLARVGSVRLQELNVR